MKYKSDFFNESCLECLQPLDLCTKKEKQICYIQWADKKIKDYKYVINKIQKTLKENL
jgi:hypothetical protein